MPILGALFRSNGFKRNETELVIVITPYLVKPVNANEIVLPTDGYQAPTDASSGCCSVRWQSGKSGEQRPKPMMATPSAPPPSIGAVVPAPVVPTPQGDKAAPAAVALPVKNREKDRKSSAATPPASASSE